MASSSDQPSYYIPHAGWYPIGVAASSCMLMVGLGFWLNDLKGGQEPTRIVFYLGAIALTVVLFAWFSKVIEENLGGLTSPQLHRSYVWAMSWFIFSEFMFFAAFFGALFYTRVLVVAWLGGEGGKGLTGDYLWPGFEASWPVMNNPDPSVFENPGGSMAAPSISNWGNYLPFWNTAILLTSSITVHFAHTAIKNLQRTKLLVWLGVTVALGIVFLFLQVEEYAEAYQDLGLTLSSGIYGSTFFLLTGFHGFHVTLGTFMLLVQLIRAYYGHFQPTDCFGFEASSWYWHFVDVVWVCLFLFVYVF